MRSRLALKGKARADPGGPGDGDQRATTQGWVAGWAEELDQPAVAAGAAAVAVQGKAAKAAGESLSSGQLVVAFVHDSSLVCVHQCPPPTSRAAVQLAEVTSSTEAHRPLPTCKAALCLSLEAAAVLAGASVPDCGGGPCMPHLLVLTPAAQLRLVRLDLEQRHAAVVWDMPPPQAPLLKPLVSIQPGPSVLLPQASGELWVACKYSAGGAPTEQPPGGAPPGLGGLWRLHKLRAEGAGDLLPCMLRPAWLAHSGAGAAASCHSAPQQAAPVPAAAVATASGAGPMLAVGPASAAPAAAATGSKHSLFYSLVTLTSAPSAFPCAPPLIVPDHPPHHQPQQQQRHEQGRQLFLTRLMLSAGGCPVSGGGPAVQCWEAPAGLESAPMSEAVTAACLVPPQKQGVPCLALASSMSELHLLPLPASWTGLWGGICIPAATGADARHLSGAAQQQVQLATPARQLHFLPGAGTTPGCLLAVCGPTGSSATSITVMSCYPGLEQLAVLDCEDPACICLPDCLGLSYALEQSQGGSTAEGPFITTAHPFAVLSRHLGKSHQPGAAVPAAGAGASYALLPAARISLEPNQHGKQAAAGLRHADGHASKDCYTLEVLHQIQQQPQSARGRASHADSEDARLGLLKVVSSLQHRVDAGQSQLVSLQQLARQKQRAILLAEGVLAHHCRATWPRQGPALVAGTSAMVGDHALPGPSASNSSDDSCNDCWAARGLHVAAVAAEPAKPPSVAGWQLIVELDVPEGLLVDASPMPGKKIWKGCRHCDALRLSPGLLLGLESSSTFLVAANPTLSTSTLQHDDCWLPPGASPPRPAAPPADRSRRLQLSCMLTVQQQQQQHLQGAALHGDPPEGLWVDVGVVLGSPPGGFDVALFGEADCSGFIPVGRVSLPWQPQFSYRGAAGSESARLQPLAQRPLQHGQDGAAGTCARDGAAPRHPWQHRLDLAVQSEAADLYWLLTEVPQQLGLAPMPTNPHSTGGEHQACYSLPAAASTSPPAAAVPAAAHVLITWHSACFAELALQADDPQLLHAVSKQLANSIRGAAKLAGAGVAVQPSVFSGEQAQQAADAAGTLLAEVDACIDWVEALLREKMVLGSQCMRDKLPNNVDGLLVKQGQALVKAVTADLAVAGLCTL